MNDKDEELVHIPDCFSTPEEPVLSILEYDYSLRSEQLKNECIYEFVSKYEKVRKN